MAAESAHEAARMAAVGAAAEGDASSSPPSRSAVEEETCAARHVERWASASTTREVITTYADAPKPEERSAASMVAGVT